MGDVRVHPLPGHFLTLLTVRFGRVRFRALIQLTNLRWAP